MPTIGLLITGRVQGVSYRYSAREEALRLGCTGWVRNREDGSVEAVVTGRREALGAFVAWCWRGPMGAAVRGVAERVMEDAVFEGFLIVR